MSDQLPEGAIPLEEFEAQQKGGNAHEAIPEGAIPLDEFNEQKYSGPLETLKTTVEQGLSGATVGFSKKAQTKLHELTGGALGSTAEDIAGREAAHPYLSALANIGGTAGLIGATGGVGGLLEGGAGLAARLGAQAVEGAGIGALNTFNDDWSQNKPLDAEKIAASGGIGGLLGLVGGAIGEKLKPGTPLAKGATKAVEDAEAAVQGVHRPVVSELDAAALEAGDFATAIKHTPSLPEHDIPKVLAGLKDTKLDKDKIIKAAEDIGAPVLEGMISNNTWVQKAEDALIKGAPTFAGVRRARLYGQVYDAVKTATSEAIGEGSPYTKAQLGNKFKDSIVEKIQQQIKPINELYDGIKQYYSVIPLSEEAAPAVAKGLKGLQEVRISPGSPEAKLANRVIREIPNLKTVDDVKAYKSVLNRSVSPTASSGEKRMAGIIGDQLSELENESVVSFAKKNPLPPEAQPMIQDLLAKRQAADSAYKQFKTKLGTLAEQLGKSRVGGAQDATHFIENLTPEEVVHKLFSKKDSEFLQFFSKNFPDQMQLMRDYQKGVIRDAASKTGDLRPSNVFREVNKLEPEIQASIFSRPELQKLTAAQTVNNAIPDSFNPSGTSHMEVFRDFFNPAKFGGTLVHNARDELINGFIKAGGGGVGEATSEALQKAAAKTGISVDKGVKAIFSGFSSQAGKL